MQKELNYYKNLFEQNCRFDFIEDVKLKEVFDYIEDNI